jgi:hypothetical protein
MPKKKKNSPTIFVQIASYRDPELLPTISDILDKADHPENLRFGIAWQHSPYETFDDISEYLTDPRFKIIDIDYRESQGACWARNLLQQKYDGEDYTLQLDSHHRFVKGWDTECIGMIKHLQKLGHSKPLLTGYIPSYNPENDPADRIEIPWKMTFDRFIPEGAVFFLPASIDNFKELDTPIPARFYSAHFCFTLGNFTLEVPHDPEYYFHGEEISIAARAFTHGYDLFHPHKVVAWHEYTRKGRTKQWDDNPAWVQKNEYCHLKNRKLFEMDGEVRDIDFGIYGFGTERTLADYEQYAGINFKTRAVQQYTLDDKLPPNPNPNDEYLNIFKHCIDIAFAQVPHDDYDVWAVAFEDENGIEIHRRDAFAEEISKMKSDPDGYCKVWRTFHTTTKPKRWVVWPHSESHGWGDRLTGVI